MLSGECDGAGFGVLRNTGFVRPVEMSYTDCDANINNNVLGSMSMKISFLVNVCAVFALTTGFADQVEAATITENHSIAVLSQSCSVSGQGGSSSLNNLSTGCSSTLSEGTFSASASAAATYDILRASASVGFSEVRPTSAPGSLLATVTARAEYEDMVTIDIPGREGDLVDLAFTTALSGTTSASTPDSWLYTEGKGGLQVRVNGWNVVVTQTSTSSGTPTDFNFNPGLVSITLGTPFSVTADLSASAKIQKIANGFLTYSGEGLANFGNSGGITSFELFESGSETLISSWDLTSESGEFGFYSAVPIPAAVWLFGSGLLGLVGLARRKKA